MRTAVMTDTNSGLSVEEGRSLGIHVLPMPVIIESESYLEGVDIRYEQVFSAMQEDRPVSTSQPSPYSVTSMWDELLASGYDEVVYIPMSSGLSGSCAGAMALAASYEGRVLVVDNHRISVTQRESALDACALARAGLSGREIADRLTQNALNASIYITVDTLKYLKRSGRVTAAAAAVASVMNIKPILTIQGDKLDAHAKLRGMHACEKKMIESLRRDLTTRFSAFDPSRIMLATAGTLRDAEQAERWRAQVAAAFPGYSVAYSPLSCSIACHVGPNALGIGVIVLDRP